MRKMIFQLFGLLLIALPQVAGAQDFRAAIQYPAKFICGYTSGGDQRMGVVEGHYNTIVNILASRDRTTLAYRATVVRSSIEVNEGEPSGFSQRFDLDRDEAIGILCSDIKRGLLNLGGEGLIEGFVTIYSTKPLDVTDVLTGESEVGHSMQVHPVSERRESVRVEPLVEAPI